MMAKNKGHSRRPLCSSEARADPAFWDQLIPCRKMIFWGMSSSCLLGPAHTLPNKFYFSGRSCPPRPGPALSLPEICFEVGADPAFWDKLLHSPTFLPLSYEPILPPEKSFMPGETILFLRGGSIFTVGIFSWVFSTWEFFLSRCDLETVLTTFWPWPFSVAFCLILETQIAHQFTKLPMCNMSINWGEEFVYEPGEHSSRCGPCHHPRRHRRKGPPNFFGHRLPVLNLHAPPCTNSYVKTTDLRFFRVTIQGL